MTTGIYLITNKINNKKYIGGGNVKLRLKDHRTKSCSQSLREDIKLYGIGNFSFKPLVYCENEYLDVLERYFIQKYKTIQLGYNEQTGGKCGYEHSTITKTKMSRKRKGLKRPQWVKDKISQGKKGKKMTNEAKRNMSESREKIAVISEEGSLFFNSVRDAMEAGYHNVSAVCNGKRKTCKGIKFRFATKQEIEERK